ncbi:histidine triad nucleotide-binding protein [Mangrovactinospora gilvigrisea]|uniref:Histidine triad nucleotide-binding protein n=1 Tax=Mangrovactinospora gilvigrisea TaxID=1428644 RepID=A0A1J7C826_9ACTN|nr:histidine triad nucleotide-binding protein [Mangrovactinospora gilvigrisea]OIV37676.1 histidine triad nucleotide-binding protein [Mangrovactinospora gilvigrisea]
MAGEPQPDCLFCKIVAGEIPSTQVRETETTLAFRDISPQAPVHVLVVPKAHYPDAAALAEADAELTAQLLREAAAVAADEGIADKGYRLVFNTGEGVGQTVFHVHCHVLGGEGIAMRLG